MSVPVTVSVPPASSTSHLGKSKRAWVEEIFDDDDLADDERENAYTNLKCECHVFNIYRSKKLTNAKPIAKKKRKSTVQADSEVVDTAGIPIDVDVQSIVDTRLTCEGKTADINEFFGTVFEQAGTNGKVKKHRKCKICL